jgi:hypothetical protein
VSLAASRAGAAPRHLPNNGRGLIFWGLALALVAALSQADNIVPWAVEYPRGWVVPLRFWISDFMKWLINDADLGLFTFKELRASSWCSARTTRSSTRSRGSHGSPWSL